VAVVAKTLVTGGTHPIQVTFYQYFFTVAIVGTWIFIRNRKAFRVDRKTLFAFALLGIVGGASTNLCFYTALKYLDAGISSMLLFLHPAFVTLFFAVTRIKTIKPFNYFSVFLAAFGAAIVLDVFSDDLSFSAIGLTFGILSAVTYAFYNIFADLKLKAQEPNVINFYACTASMLFTMTLLIGSGIGFQVEPAALPGILFITTFSGVLPVYCFFKALQYIGSEKVSVISCIELPLTLIMAFTVLSEHMEPTQLFGVILIVLATFLLHRNEKPEAHMYQILESDDYEALTYLFHENGLEITPGIHKPDEVIKFWECKDPDSQRLIGGAALETRSGVFVVADLAVDRDYRNQNIGKQMMDIVEAEIIRRGGSEAWLVGKVPDFYLKLGWEVIAREKAPEISNCFSCSRYGKECNPQVMHKTLTF
jgi:drug/metabolite transporter (DMT)-like permease/N-acetylglutamate synthase-like GNAT family acetyltransferase